MRTKHIVLFLAALFIMAFGAACQSQGVDSTAEGSDQMAIKLTSSAFTEGGTIPKKYTCDGEDVSPPIDWSGVPEGAGSLALIVDDPDAPAGTWVHWVLFNLPPDLSGLPEGAQGLGTEGTTSFREIGYGGPCPPRGKPHRYVFKLFVVDQSLGLKAGARKSDLEQAMRNHILAQGQLIGTYGR